MLSDKPLIRQRIASDASSRASGSLSVLKFAGGAGLLVFSITDSRLCVAFSNSFLIPLMY
jgi:hypothetical protein